MGVSFPRGEKEDGRTNQTTTTTLTDALSFLTILSNEKYIVHNESFINSGKDRVSY